MHLLYTKIVVVVVVVVTVSNVNVLLSLYNSGHVNSYIMICFTRMHECQ